MILALYSIAFATDTFKTDIHVDPPVIDGPLSKAPRDALMGIFLTPILNCSAEAAVKNGQFNETGNLHFRVLPNGEVTDVTTDLSIVTCFQTELANIRFRHYFEPSTVTIHIRAVLLPAEAVATEDACQKSKADWSTEECACPILGQERTEASDGGCLCPPGQVVSGGQCLIPQPFPTFGSSFTGSLLNEPAPEGPAILRTRLPSEELACQRFKTNWNPPCQGE